MASIEPRKNNSFMIRVSNGRDGKGKIQWITTTYHAIAKTPAKAKKEAEAYAVKFEEQVKSGKYYSGDKNTFSDIVKEWHDNWALSHLQQSQVEYYDTCLEKNIIPEIGNLKINKISPINCQNLINSMEKKGLAPATIRKRFTIMNSVFSYAYRLNIIQENPCDRCELPHIKTDEELHSFSLEQAIRFVTMLNDEYTVHYGKRTRTDGNGNEYTVSEYEVNQSISLMWIAYFTIAIFAGFRRGEMLALTWNDVDFEEHSISINKAVANTKGGQIIKEPKSKAGKREIVLPQVCFDLLERWKKEQKERSEIIGSDWKGTKEPFYDDNYVFIQKNGSMMHLSTPYHKFHEVLEMFNFRIKNPEDKLPVIRLHDLRHTSATLLLAYGTDIETVSKRIGHSRASITLDVYGHALKEKDRTASDILEGLFTRRNTPETKPSKEAKIYS